MKNAVKFFMLVLTVGLIFVLVGCKKPEPTPEPTPEVTNFNVLGNWTDGGDAVYTIATNTASELDFTYDKSTFPYAFLQSAAITEDLSVFKSLEITLEGTGTMLLKLETKDDTPAKEVSLNVTGIQGTYEWNLKDDSAFLAKVDRVVIIAAPGKQDSVGAITVSKLSFDVSIADGYIINEGFNNIPSNVNEYNGTDEVFSFNSKWEGSDEDVYTISYEETETEVAYDKGTGMEWSFIRSRVQGDFTAFNYAVIVVSGTSGHKILVKPNEYNKVEEFIYLDGSEQEIVIDLTELTLEEKNAITDFKVFIAAGLTPAQGEITIHEAFLIDEYDYEEPIIEVNTYNGTDKSFALKYFYDGGDLVYDISESGTDYVVAYDKNSNSLTYAYMYANLSGDFSSFTKIEFDMTGQSTKTLLLKVEFTGGNKEIPQTFDGTRQVFTFDLTTLTKAQLETLNKVVLFAAPGAAIGSGEFTIHNITFKTSDYEVDTEWESLVPGVYTFIPGETLMVNYVKNDGDAWAGIRNTLDAEKVAGLNTLIVVLKGTAGKSVMIKPNDSQPLEQVVNFVDADPVTVTVTAASFTSIIMFGEPNVAPATGSFEIVSLTLTYVEPEADFDPTLIVDFNSDWVKDTAKEAYTFDFQSTKTVVNYNKLAGGNWDWIKVVFDQKEIQGLNTLTLVLKGTEGKQILVKPNDSGDMQQFISFGADPVTVVVHASEFYSVFLFAEPDVAPATGSFEILSATLSYTLEIGDEGWVSNDEDAYTILDGVVTYNKVEGQTYSAFVNTFDQEQVAGLNTLTVVLKGTDGKSVILKPNDNGALEQTVTFVGTDSVTKVFTAEAFNKMVIMAEGGVAPATGTFEIVSLTLTYVKPEVDFDPTLVVSIGDEGWVANDEGTYTILDGVVTYDKVAGKEYSAFVNTFDQEQVAGLNTLTVVIKGTDGKSVILKPNDNGALEQTVSFVGTTEVTKVFTAEAFSKMVIMAEGGIAPAAGSFEIVSMTLSYVVFIGDEGWVANDEGTYTILDGVVTYDKVAGKEYSAFVNTFDQEQVAGLNTLTVVIKGTDGKSVILKPNDNGALEQTVSFVGTTEVTKVFTAEAFSKMVIMAEGGIAPATGSFEIVSMTLSYVEQVIDFDPTLILDFNDEWVKDAGKDVYTFDFQAEKTVVNYVKTTGGEWDWAKVDFDAEEVFGLNTLTIVLQGTEGKQVLVKPNNSIEKWVTFGTEPVTVVVRADSFFTVLVFGEPNVAPATGSFEILSVTLSYTVVIGDEGWVSNDAGSYTIADGIVTYDKLAGKEYSAFVNTFDQEQVAGLNTLTVVLKGTDGKSLILKPNNDGALEYTVNFSGTDTVTKVFTAAEFISLVIMAEGGTAPAAGSFEIVSIVLSYVEPVVE